MVMREVGGAGVRGAAWSAPDPLAKRGAMSGATPELGTDSWDRGGGLGFVLEHVCVITKPKQASHGSVSPRGDAKRGHRYSYRCRDRCQWRPHRLHRHDLCLLFRSLCRHHNHTRNHSRRRHRRRQGRSAKRRRYLRHLRNHRSRHHQSRSQAQSRSEVAVVDRQVKAGTPDARIKCGHVTKAWCWMVPVRLPTCAYITAC